jgi:hypothetical protein
VYRVEKENQVMTILDQIRQRGAHVKIAPGTVDHAALATELVTLRVAGHAVVAEETFDHRRKSLGVTVIHYLTCAKCAHA